MQPGMRLRGEMGEEHGDLVGARVCGTAVDDDPCAVNGMGFAGDLENDGEFSPL